MRKNFLVILLMVVIGFAAFPAWSNNPDLSPDKLVERTVQEVVGIMQKDEDLKNGNKEKLLNLIETKILPHFNFVRMTQLAMAQHWQAAS